MERKGKDSEISDSIRKWKGRMEREVWREIWREGGLEGGREGGREILKEGRRQEGREGGINMSHLIEEVKEEKLKHTQILYLGVLK